jgi:tetratricopeptide (TPR) repeat protein
MSMMAQLLPGAGATAGNHVYDLQHTNWLVVGKVKTIEGNPVRGAAVMVAPLGASSRVVFTDARGEFSTEYDLNVRTTNELKVVQTVKKKGFQTAHAYADYKVSGQTWRIPLTLRGLEEDPTQLSSTDLIAGLAPRLKQLGPAEGLAAKSARDYSRGVSDFLERNNPERAIPLLVEVVEGNPSCISCRTMLGLAEIAWDDWDDAKNTLAESVNATLQNRQMGLSEPMVAYGTWLNWQREPEKAQPFFVEALKFRSEDALALQELGRTLQLTRQFEAANSALKRALAAGSGSEARLLYAESWLGVGRSDEASAEMNRYLGGRDVKEMPLRVRQVWAELQSREKMESSFAKNKLQKTQEHLDFVQHPPDDMIHGIELAKGQEQLSFILDGVGTKILEMVKSFPNTTADEAIHQEKLSRKGAVRGAQDQRFRYLCLAPNDAEMPDFVEYRADSSGYEVIPKGLGDGFMLTRGFTSSPLIFHPAYRSESTFRYLGRQNVNGRPTHVVAFAQLPGKARLVGSFQNGGDSVTTLLQGLAWIDTTNYEIVRMHTDLLAPLPELGLKRAASDVVFNEVRFSRLKDSYWLPEEVTVTLDWNGKLLLNKHAYSAFKIFAVDATEKVGNPKASADSSAGPKGSTASQ